MTKVFTVSDALSVLAPDATWVVRNGTEIDWLDNGCDKPSDEDIALTIKRLSIEYELSEYQRNRATAYPPIGDQLDALFHAGVFPPEMAEQIAAVKAAYPKPDNVE